MRTLLHEPPQYIYFVAASWAPLIKVGRTTGVYARFHSLQNGAPEPLHLVDVFRASADMEPLIKSALRQHRFSREWFRFTRGVADFVDRLQQAREELFVARIRGGDVPFVTSIDMSKAIAGLCKLPWPDAEEVFEYAFIEMPEQFQPGAR